MSDFALTKLLPNPILHGAAMQRRAGFTFQTCVPTVRRADEPFPIDAWTWWYGGVFKLMAVLTGSQGPWTSRTESYRWLRWIVVDELQVQVLLRFIGEARGKFGLDALHYEYHPVTFGLVE